MQVEKLKTVDAESKKDIIMSCSVTTTTRASVM